MLSAPVLFNGQVMHRRLRPTMHAFRYSVHFITLPLATLEQAGNRLFGVNKRRLFSVYWRDYGPGDGTAPDVWLRELLRREGIDLADGAIVLQTFPRVLGFVFNPISFWYCHDPRGELRAVICEVNNTFGERHSYLLAHTDSRVIGAGETLSARKMFHVSPFFAVEGEYRFRFRIGNDRLLARIEYFDREGDLLNTSVSGGAEPWTERSFLRLFLTHGWMTALVIARIHYQAVRLWFKGIAFYRKPAPPTTEVTVSLREQ